MNRARPLLIGALALVTAGCTATTYADRTGDQRVRGALEQPFRDVSVMREDPPEILIRAAEAPYALDGVSECGALLEELSALDSILGPDLDQPDEHREQSSTDAGGLLSGAIRGLIDLPYRSIVRRVTGAERRERELRDAILAGMVRRAYLKGVAISRNCTATTAPAVELRPDAEASPAQPGAVTQPQEEPQPRQTETPAAEAPPGEVAPPSTAADG